MKTGINVSYNPVNTNQLTKDGVTGSYKPEHISLQKLLLTIPSSQNRKRLTKIGGFIT